MSVLSSESGFSRKSKAPSLVARTAVSMVPCPEMITTSGGSSNCLIFSSVSRPSMPGSHISRSTTSQVRFFNCSRQASPLSASSTLYPSSSRTPRSDSRISRSSSTTRMLCTRRLRCRHLACQRQLYQELCARRLVLFHADGTMMIVNDAANDSQSQPGAAFFGGKIWQKQFFFYLAIDAVPGIGNHNLQAVTPIQQRCGDMYFPHARILHGFSGVVDQVGQRALDRFRIGHGQRQIGVQLFFHAYSVQPSVEH